MERVPKIFLDCGAFTAYNSGKTIDCEGYIRFIKDHEGLFDYYSVLDIIGVNGLRGTRLTAERTLANQHKMEQAGLHPLPCFHYGEPWEYLQDYAKKYNYIGLGLTKSYNDLIPYLNSCFSICTHNGNPKVHAFGSADIKVLSVYPFYSSDATTWMTIGRYGSIFVPPYSQGRWLYNKDPWQIGISSKSSKQKMPGKHISTLIYPEPVIKYISEKGFTEEELANSDDKRNEINIRYYADFINATPELTTNMYTGVSTVRHVQAVSTIQPKMDILVSYYYGKTKPMLKAVSEYKYGIQ